MHASHWPAFATCTRNCSLVKRLFTLISNDQVWGVDNTHVTDDKVITGDKGESMGRVRTDS